jgi:prevent-host-death family protein
MQTVNIHEAKTNLSRLIAEAEKGEGFVIARAGKPLVKVTAIHTQDGEARRRLGFMQGTMQVPEDFDRMGSEEIAGLFAGTAT